MANSVDPDQTAPLGAVWSGAMLFAYPVCHFVNNFGVWNFTTFTVHHKPKLHCVYLKWYTLYTQACLSKYLGQKYGNHFVYS